MCQWEVHRFFPAYLFRFGSLLIFSAAFWYEGAEAHMVGTNPYHRVETLDSQGKFVLEWEVDRSAKKVTFHVAAATRGYVGFGLSDKGKMSGADIIIGGVLPNGKSYFSDRHAVANQIPEIDPSQDWTLLEARENKTHTFLSFSRAFDTCDPQDYVLVDDKVSLIWALGEKDDPSDYHFGNRGEYPIHLLSPDYTPPIDRDPKTGFPVVIHSPFNEDVKVWSWNISYTMPAEETTYRCSMHKGPVLPRKHHYVGIETRFPDEISRRHLHHIIVAKCHAPQGFKERAMFHQYVGQSQGCFGAAVRSSNLQSPAGPIPIEYCTDYITGYAIGERIVFLPPHVGTAFGETRDEYYAIQVHYDNPEMRPGIQVNVHLDVFYTPHIRENEGEVFVIRHESPGLPPSHLIPPSSIAHMNHAICGSECTRKMFPKEGIKIVALQLHAHNSAVRIRLRHFRGNRELPFVAAEDNYDFGYQQTRVLPGAVQILPGDQLMVECITDNTWSNGTVVGGFSTRQEMCVSWITYYNKLQNNMVCTSEIVSPEFREYFLGIQNISWSNQDIEYVADSPRHLAGLTVTQVSNQLDWTLKKRDELQRFQLTHPQVNRCPDQLYTRRHTANANGEPVDLEPEQNVGTLTPIPRPAVPYSHPPSCSATKHNSSNNNKYGANAGRDNYL